MARVIVRHLEGKDGELRRDMCCIYDDDRRLEYATEALKRRLYTTVADLELGGSLTSILDEAWRLTNSVDEAWYENTDILMDEATRKGCRSSSVGDVIEVAGESYMVAGFGFKHIDLGLGVA